MSNIQSIIVYRNPMEAAFWELVSGGEFFAVFVGVMVFFAIFLLVNRMMTGGRSWGYPAWYTTFALGLGAFAGFGTMFYLFSKI